MSYGLTITKVHEIVKVAVASSAYSTYPIAFQNQPFTQPTNSPFFSVRVLEAGGFPTNLGRSIVDRHVGIVQVDVYGVLDTGTKNLADAVEMVGNALRRGSVVLTDGSFLRFRIPSFMNNQAANERYCFSMKIDYWRDEVAK